MCYIPVHDLRMEIAVALVLDHDRIGPNGRPVLRLKASEQQIIGRTRQRGLRVIDTRSSAKTPQESGSASTRAKMAALKWLKASFPVFKRSLPLPIGAHDLVAPAAEKAGISGVAIRAAIAMHVASRRYLAACARAGACRHDLAGQPSAPLSREHRAHAAARLAAMPKLHNRRR